MNDAPHAAPPHQESKMHSSCSKDDYNPYRKPIHPTILSQLTPNNCQAIENLLCLPPPSFDYSSLNRKAQAAVAILLFQPSRQSIGILSGLKSYSPSHLNPDSIKYQPQVPQDLHVILTTRSNYVNSHPGQTSLPGGKVDFEDISLEHTALRECKEEIGLDIDNLLPDGHLSWVCTGEPFISKTSLLVHPCVFLLSPTSSKLDSILSSLSASPSEVSKIWSNPFKALLSSEPPNEWQRNRLSYPELVDTHRKPQVDYRTYSDVPFLSLDGRKKEIYRLHRFRSGEELIKGLTADILLSLSSKAYQEPLFSIRAPTQPPFEKLREIVIERIKRGERNEKRWGDGESGDGKGREEEFRTFVGRDGD